MELSKSEEGADDMLAICVVICETLVFNFIYDKLILSPKKNSLSPTDQTARLYCLELILN